MKKITQITKLLVVALFMLASTAVLAQSSISGSIKGQSGETLPGVSILLKGTAKGDVSDFDGNYKISNIVDGTYKLVVSYVGFDSFTQEVIVSGNNVTVNIVMVENAESLDEIIITGVSNPKSKIESSISITTMRPETIKQSAPRTTAEIFRTIPGIRSESS